MDTIKSQLAQLELDFKTYTDKGEWPCHAFLNYYYSKKAELESQLK